jgi:pimeloyl-ACP methyl ester carboxylesterase
MPSRPWPQTASNRAVRASGSSPHSQVASTSGLRDDVQMDRRQAAYAWNGDDSLAYQVVGDGPLDLVYLQGHVSNVILGWEHPAYARFLRELSRFSRVIVTDRRGLGCSDRFTPADIPPIETLVDDLRAVLDAAGSERPVLFGTGECGFITMLLAATYPERVAALILYGASATWRKSEENPWGSTDEDLKKFAERDCCDHRQWWLRTNPSLAADESGLAWCMKYSQVSIAPGNCIADGSRFDQTDVRGILATIQVPTLILYRGEGAERVRDATYLGSRIRMARLAELRGLEVFPWSVQGDTLHRHRRLDREGRRTRPAHWRGREHDGQHGARYRRQHRRSDRRNGRPISGARLPDRQRPCRRFRTSLRGSRRARPKGHSRDVARF